MRRRTLTLLIIWEAAATICVGGSSSRSIDSKAGGGTPPSWHFTGRRITLCQEAYTIQNRLAQSSTGSVYKASAASKQEFAVKVMEYPHRRKHIKYYETELSILKTLPFHENILSAECIEEVEIDTRRFAFVLMDYCPAGDLLQHIIDAGVPFDERRVRAYLLQITSAVNHLYEHGIMHRDLKLENLLVDPSGRIQLIDFGLAIRLDRGQREISGAVGTIGYVAPEVLYKKTYLYNADVWSLGVCLYIMITGCAFTHGNTKALDYLDTVRQYLRIHKGVAGLPDFIDASTELRDLIAESIVWDPYYRIGFEQFVARATLEPKRPGFLLRAMATVVNLCRKISSRR